MIEFFGAVIHNGHNVGIVVFVIVVERVEEETQTDPFVRRAENFAVISTLRLCVPESLERKLTNVNTFTGIDLRRLTRPSAPIRPRPVILNEMSTSHQSKFIGCLVHIAPFWLRSDGAIRTFSELAIASNRKSGSLHCIYKIFSKKQHMPKI